MRVIVTGGARFIGTAVVRDLVAEGHDVQTVEALTYAGNLASLEAVEDSASHHFLQANIRDSAAMVEAVSNFQPDRITHLAEESHVDRTISGAAYFVTTNVMGTLRCA